MALKATIYSVTAVNSPDFPIAILCEVDNKKSVEAAVPRKTVCWTTGNCPVKHMAIAMANGWAP